jgi:Ser/Thr protein kinase RdoA (MazF antagonist)
MRDDVLHLYDAGLPVANIHGDLWASNVFAENGRITAVFDLETTEKTLRVLDIGRTATDLALEMKTTSVLDILEMLRDSYEEVEALTDKERDALLDAFRLATVACSAWNYNNGFQHRRIIHRRDLLGDGRLASQLDPAMSNCWVAL